MSKQNVDVHGGTVTIIGGTGCNDLSTLKQFRTRHKQFEDTMDFTDQVITDAINDARNELGCDPDYWCGEYNYTRMVFALAAHELVMDIATSAGDGSAKRAIQSKSAGGVSVTYDAALPVSGTYQTSRYGQLFFKIKKAVQTF